MQYDEITVGGEPYPTRNRPAFSAALTTSHALYDLPTAELHTVIAVHEAGHAVAHLAGGRAHLIEATITAGAGAIKPGVVRAVSYDTNGREQVISVCAGERAADMWLHRHGLWTSARATAAEIGARYDRARALSIPGMTHALLRDMHDPTDDLLAAHWARVEAVTEALLAAGSLTGAEVAAITGLTNPANPLCPA